MKNELSKTLKSDSKNRKKMMEEVTSSMDSYAYRIIDLENKIKEYELEEIKYKNLERENKELVKIYNLKLQELEEKTNILENENTEIKKELINEQATGSKLKSFLQVVVNHYGLEELEQLSGISIDKIKEYLL